MDLHINTDLYDHSIRDPSLYLNNFPTLKSKSSDSPLDLSKRFDFQNISEYNLETSYIENLTKVLDIIQQERERSYRSNNSESSRSASQSIQTNEECHYLPNQQPTNFQTSSSLCKTFRQEEKSFASYEKHSDSEKGCGQSLHEDGKCLFPPTEDGTSHQTPPN
ncbi:hypothetical protein FGO68_gene17607 [Halteria grandinella]|uniref:Uncharacterized protein n=1 Tax=Halteria grandinella TaxID=5974 RepID=A0A8J8NQM1_HALGN|nr:hypothetical protein FGO68_gene17607 [Halteria grandinella]